MWDGSVAGPDCPSILTRWWKHRGCKPVSVLIAEDEEHRHDPLDVRFQPDILLDVGPGWRDIARLGLFTRLPKELLDRMAHQSGFPSRFHLGLDLKPRLPIRGIAYVAHDPAHL